MPERLSNLIIEHGPYYAAQLNPITAPTTAELNELREELIAARKLREELRAILDRWEGRTGDAYDIRQFSADLRTLADWGARKVPDLRRYTLDAVPTVDGGELLWLTHMGCPDGWRAEYGHGESDLAELNQRAAEHAEVCG